MGVVLQFPKVVFRSLARERAQKGVETDIRDLLFAVFHALYGEVPWTGSRTGLNARFLNRVLWTRAQG